MHHVYDRFTNVLYMGNGTKRSAKVLGLVINLTAGNGNSWSPAWMPLREETTNAPR